MPNYDVPQEFATHYDYLEKLTYDGLKNRYGESNVEDACVFYGDINLWRELPRADAITSYERLNNPDWDFSNEDISINEDNSLANFNFTL